MRNIYSWGEKKNGIHKTPRNQKEKVKAISQKSSKHENPLCDMENTDLDFKQNEGPLARLTWMAARMLTPKTTKSELKGY